MERILLKFDTALNSASATYSGSQNLSSIFISLSVYSIMFITLYICDLSLWNFCKMMSLMLSHFLFIFLLPLSFVVCFVVCSVGIPWLDISSCWFFYLAFLNTWFLVFYGKFQTYIKIEKNNKIHVSIIKLSLTFANTWPALFPLPVTSLLNFNFHNQIFNFRGL